MGQVGISNHHSLLETSSGQLPRAHLAVFTERSLTPLNELCLVFSSPQRLFQRESFIVHLSVHREIALKFQNVLKARWVGEAEPHSTKCLFAMSKGLFLTPNLPGPAVWSPDPWGGH